MAGLVAFDRFHQSDVAFLDKVGLVQTIAVVASCDRYDDAQMGKDELFGGVKVAFLFTLRELSFFFGRQHGNAVDGMNVLLKTTVAAVDDG